MTGVFLKMLNYCFNAEGFRRNLLQKKQQQVIVIRMRKHLIKESVKSQHQLSIRDSFIQIHLPLKKY